MPINPQEFAGLLGAKIVGEVPDVGGGPFGMALLAHIMHQRLRAKDGVLGTQYKEPCSEENESAVGKVENSGEDRQG